MKIGILEAGPPPVGLEPKFGRYCDVFRRYLSAHEPTVTVENWAVIDMALPEDPGQADAWLITGSRYGVYEDHAWIPPLKAFIRACKDAGAPVVGICFGHQIMAEALGGRAEKFAGGWGLGAATYAVDALPDWAPAPPSELRLNAVHQDQVTQLAPDAATFAHSDFCANAAILYGDPVAPYALSIQPHPEFDDVFLADLLEARRATLPADHVAAAEGNLGGRLDRAWTAELILSFLRQGMPK